MDTGVGSALSSPWLSLLGPISQFRQCVKSWPHLWSYWKLGRYSGGIQLSHGNEFRSTFDSLSLSRQPTATKTRQPAPDVPWRTQVLCHWDSLDRTRHRSFRRYRIINDDDDDKQKNSVIAHAHSRPGAGGSFMSARRTESCSSESRTRCCRCRDGSVARTPATVTTTTTTAATRPCSHSHTHGPGASARARRLTHPHTATD